MGNSDENGKTNGSRFNFPNIFTEKVVGIAFAVAFALWAWMLNQMAGNVLEAAADIKKEQSEIKQQIYALREVLNDERLRTSLDISDIRGNVNALSRRVDGIERHIETEHK